LRVVIGEDQALMREGLVLLLEQRGFDVVGVAADRDDLGRKAKAHDPDVVVADIRMPPTQTDEGLRAALEIRQSRPHIAILVLSQHVQRQYARELLESGGGVTTGQSITRTPPRAPRSKTSTTEASSPAPMRPQPESRRSAGRRPLAWPKKGGGQNCFPSQHRCPPRPEPTASVVVLLVSIAPRFADPSGTGLRIGSGQR
jgi:CheY-like chemotaxis protein